MTTLPAASTTDFTANLAQLTDHLKEDQALYLLLRQYGKTVEGGKTALLAVTYVPDTAKVRQKMLFASTRLTLVRELGKEHFPETLLVTMAEELTPAGFERHARHSALEAPLTEQERTLGEVRRAEAEAGSGMGVRELTLSKHMNMPVDEDALAALATMGRGETNIVILVSRNFLPKAILRDGATRKVLWGHPRLARSVGGDRIRSEDSGRIRTSWNSG